MPIIVFRELSANLVLSYFSVQNLCANIENICATIYKTYAKLFCFCKEIFYDFTNVLEAVACSTKHLPDLAH